jgi:branched-chain amino acid transport system permease protein
METPAHLYSPKRLIVLLLILLAFTIPFFVTSRFYLHILIMCFIWGMAATSMNLLMGYTGQVNLAHGAFFGIGAYAAGLLILKLGLNFWPALILACIITVASGFFIGVLALRTKGSYFAIGTMCFNVIVTASFWRTDRFYLHAFLLLSGSHLSPPDPPGHLPHRSLHDGPILHGHPGQ